MRKSSRLPLAVRSLTKTIELPSGEYAGSASSAGLSVSRTWFEPSAFMFQTSRLPASSRSESKTSVRPSGDQLGFWPPTFALSVSWVCALPSAFMSHTCRCPERLLVNAILDPSGDQAGSASSAAEVVSRDLPGAVAADRVDVEVAVAGRLEGDAITVVAPGRVAVEPLRERELPKSARVGRHTEDVGVAAACRLERDSRAVRRPRRLRVVLPSRA